MHRESPIDVDCIVCGGRMTFAFNATVLRKYAANYFVCNHCGFLIANEPFWLSEAYASAIAAADTGLMARNILLSKKVAGVLYWIFGERGDAHYLDAAGGYGILTRLMRDMGFDFYWEDKYCANLVAPGFEYSSKIGPCRAITAMEVLEHLIDPVAYVNDTMAAAGTKTMLFSTELYEGDPPSPRDWWYYSFETGQHICFFQRRTLEAMSARLGLKFVSANGIHIFSDVSVDERLLKLATGRWSTRLSPSLIMRRLGSKVMVDHSLMMGKAD